MLKDTINNEYFDWMYDIVCHDRYSNRISYRKLLMFLHNTEFRYSILRDENRADDGYRLRYRFTTDKHYEDEDAEYIDGHCSVLEMMLALAIRCEESIMDDPHVGDRTSQWFWGMINNLGLGAMNDNIFDKKEASYIVERFLDREYERNGKGGLFTVRNCRKDLRKAEIWYQLCWYLDGIIGD